MPKEEFKNVMGAMRETLAKLVASAVLVKGSVQKTEAAEGQEVGEMIANIMLGLRHLEDAAMRFGKAIQASEGGVSPLGGPQTPGR